VPARPWGGPSPEDDCEKSDFTVKGRRLIRRDIHTTVTITSRPAMTATAITGLSSSQNMRSSTCATLHDFLNVSVATKRIWKTQSVMPDSEKNPVCFSCGPIANTGLPIPHHTAKGLAVTYA